MSHWDEIQDLKNFFNYFMEKLPFFGQLFLHLRVRVKGRFGMSGKSMDAELKERIREGQVRREDVVRRLAELAFGRANDCVKLVLDENARLDKLDLSLLSEVKRNDKGTVEVRLIDRLRALEQLQLLASESGKDVEAFMRALQGEKG